MFETSSGGKGEREGGGGMFYGICELGVVRSSVRFTELRLKREGVVSLFNFTRSRDLVVMETFWISDKKKAHVSGCSRLGFKLKTISRGGGGEKGKGREGG